MVKYSFSLLKNIIEEEIGSINLNMFAKKQLFKSSIPQIAELPGFIKNCTFYLFLTRFRVLLTNEEKENS
jgi:hypothetical protein